MPDDWWATHFLAFMPSPWNYVLATLAGGLLILAFFLKPTSNQNAGNFKGHWLISIVIGMLCGMLFYHFPIAVDPYGNARSFMPYMDNTVDVLPDHFWRDLLSFQLKPGNGRWGVFHSFTLIAYTFKITYRDVFLLANAICGGLFIFTWLRFVASRITNTTWRVSVSIAGVISPFFLIFLGHIETYAPLYLILLWYLILLSRQIETKKAWLFIPLLLLLLFGIRFHTLMYLLLPSFILAIFNQEKGDTIWFKKLTTIKGLSLWLFLPVCLGGLVLYFFILGDYNDPRFLDENVSDIERLFLPIISPEAPLDKYNLQSWNHIFDFINVILHWSPALLLVIAVSVLLFRKSISQSLGLNVMLFTLSLFVSFLFMFNPLMGMPMDWDLFMFPAPFVMVIAILLVQKIQQESVSKSLVFSVLSIALISFPIFVVNASRNQLSYRMESLGVHVYKTYYAHSAAYLLEAIGMIPNDLPLYMERKQQLLKKLEPLAQPGIDKKYAELLTDDGIYKFNYLNRLEEAKADFQKSLYYWPKSYESWYYLAKTNLKLGKPEMAYQNAKQLNNYLEIIGQPHVLNLLIKCALETGDTTAALHYGENYLLVIEDDQLIHQIVDRLKKNEPIDDLKAQLSL